MDEQASCSYCINLNQSVLWIIVNRLQASFRVLGVDGRNWAKLIIIVKERGKD